MLNTYRVTFTTGEYWELNMDHMRRHHYRMIVNQLIENEDNLNGGHNIAKLYCRNTCIAIFELFNWGDGTGDIYLYGLPIRHVTHLKEA